MERLPRPPTAQQSHDGCGRGLHPPLPATRSASRLSTYPLLRIPGQLPSPNQTGSLPPIVSSLLPTGGRDPVWLDRKSTRLNSSHQIISYAVFCLKKKKTTTQ